MSSRAIAVSMAGSELRLQATCTNSETGWARACNRRWRCGRRLRTLRNVPRVGAKINLRRLPKRAHATKINLRRILLCERCVSLFVHKQRRTSSPSIHRTHARTSPASWIGERLLHSPGCVSRHAGSRPGITSRVHGASSAAEHHVVHQTRALDSHTGRARHMHRTRAPDACTGCVHRSPDVRTGCAPGAHPGRAH